MSEQNKEWEEGDFVWIKVTPGENGEMRFFTVTDVEKIRHSLLREILEKVEDVPKNVKLVTDVENGELIKSHINQDRARTRGIIEGYLYKESK